ncbi:MAG: Gldg family protein [Thermodesulfobacteriota bacterium]
MTRPKKGFDVKKTTLSIVGLIVLLLILVVANIIISYANVRWDATEEKNYSLSKGTLNILASMNRPVVIKFFYTKSNPDLPAEIKLYARRIKDFLFEYEHVSDGMIRVETYDPGPDSDEEEWAEKYGLRSVEVPGGEKIYCGLAFVCEDKEATIGWLDASEEQLLEYDITRTIQGLQRTQKQVVGIISGLPVFGNPQQPPMARQGGGKPWLFVTELKKTYEVKKVDPESAQIDPSIDLLLVVFPKNIAPQLKYAVDQYVLSGGKALIFVDPLCVSDNSGGQQQFMAPMGASLKDLFTVWGISMDPKMAVADFDQSTQVRGRSGVEDNPLMISARKKAFNPNDIITSGLESMLFPVAGAIQRSGNADYEFEPLVSSSANTDLMEATKAHLGVEAIKKDFVPDQKRYHMAVRIRGKFETAFPSGPPQTEGETDTADALPAGHLQTGTQPATIIVVSDADMLADNFYVQKRQVLGFAISEMFNDNFTFVANASEILTGSDDLIGLRTRGKLQRPFTTVLELKRRAQDRWLAKEKELMTQIEAANRKLRELEKQKDASQKLIISPRQEEEIARFKQRRDRINDELKEVRKKLRSEIETLGTVLKAINIFLMPLVVILIGAGFAIYKHRKMKRK